MADAAMGTACCGNLPALKALFIGWSLSPHLIGALTFIALAYRIGAIGMTRREHGWFYAGWSVTAFALISPLNALSHALYTARVCQQMVLVLLAAPMTALGRPLDSFARLLAIADRGLNPVRLATTAPFAAIVFGAALWYWRAPVAYEATFAGAASLWSMQATLFAAALWMWSAFLLAPWADAGGALAACLLSALQMSVLGALIMRSPELLYPAYADTTAAWGLTPISDQQLGGAIMVILGGGVFLSAATVELRRLVSLRHQHEPEIGAAAH